MIGAAAIVAVILVVCVTSCLTTLVVLALLTREIPLSKDQKIKLGSPEYDLQAVKSPVAQGKILVFLSKIMGNNFFGHFITRKLLNKNMPNMVRELAQQAADQNVPIVSKPICRVDSTSTVTDAMALTCEKAVQKGITRSYDDNEVMGVMDYYQAYKSKSTTPTQMMERFLEKMETFKWMNMFVSCDQEDVLAQARASSQRCKMNKPLSVFDGVPISVKDMTKVKGYKCSHGLVLRDFDPVDTVDDIMVKRFREAGAIIVGKTTMTEYGRCPLGYNSNYKGPFNPYDERCYSGGSSSGSVCSVMTGLVPIGISFDGGGSIRLPAALSGAFGLAPTFGRIPFDSAASDSSDNTHAGVNTATTTDTALAYSLLAQNDDNSLMSKMYDGGVTGPPRPHLAGFDDIDDFTGLKIGIFSEYFNHSDPEIVAQCKAVITELERRGGKVVEVKIPHLEALSLSHGLNISSSFSHNAENDFYQRNDLEPATRIQLQVGKTVTAVELLSCNRMRGWAIEYIKNLFAEQMDVFITPACPIVAPRIPTGALAHGESNLPLFSTVMRYIFLVNLAGFPGIALPVGYSEKDNQLPISMHIMANHWNDAILLRISHFVEKKIFKRKLPKHFAHMSLE